jgi:Rps23 Pro-64 3,4-dihydroxylase Tpa1-like proline 4-hydroxylase
MINNVYTNKKVLSEMEGFFTENGFIQLSDFLTENFKEFRENIEKENLLEIYEPLFQKKKMLDMKNVYKLELIKVIEFFKSKEFLEFIEEITDFELNMSKFEVNVYSHKDFILLNDETKRDESVSLVYDLSDEFNEHMGGVLTYTTKEEEIFYLEPSFNCLSIFYDPIEVMKYLKYINNHSHGLKLIRIEMEFSPVE